MLLSAIRTRVGMAQPSWTGTDKHMSVAQDPSGCGGQHFTTVSFAHTNGKVYVQLPLLVQMDTVNITYVLYPDIQL